MKLSDFNITNQLHGRWCRFIIHRYLGQFLERNLELNQLSLNLTNGELLIEEVNINVHYVNELLTSLKVPLKLIDGFVGEIRIEVPWTQLLSNSTNLKIKDLQLTFQAKEVNIDENDIASMIGSVVDKLVSSQELARSFYEEETQSGEVMNESDGSDGIKSFTKVIDAIVARFCVDLADTTIRLENHATASSEMCTAIEFRAKTMQFMDEQMKNCRLDNRSAEVITSQPQGIGNITNLNKYVFLSGVELFTDVFSRIDDIPVNIGESSTSQVLTSMYIRREKLKQKSPTVSPHESLNADLFTSTMTSVSNFQSCHSQLPFNSTLNAQLDSLQVPRNENMLLSNPIKFAELAGDQCEIQIQIHNSDNNSESSDYKVNLNVDCKGMNIFISPSQIDIIKKFVNSISLPSAKASRAELGKKMEQKDFDVIVRHMEEITFQGNTAGRTNALGGGMGMGGWRNQENFGEFDNVSLDDTLNGNSDGSTGNPYVSLKDSSGRKEGTHLKIHFVRLNIVIPHEDIFSRERVETLPRKYHDAVNQLQNLAENFFKHCSQLKVQAHTPLHKVREQFDRLYPKNHLRFVGTSVIVKYDVEKLTGQEHMRFKLSVNNCDVLEYLTPESNPLEKNRCHYPIFDFSEFENTEHVEHLKVFYATSSGSSDEPQAQICIGDCRVELDLSIVDRLCDLLATKPFFDRTFSRNRLDSISRNQMHLSEDLFSPTTKKESSVQVRWKVLCNKLTLDLRVPIADLRNPKADRLPYRQRNVHPEFIRLCLKEIQIDIPIHDEMVKVGVACTELTGEFLGVSEEFEIRSEDLTFLYGAKLGNRFVRIDFEYDPRNKSLKTNTNIHLPAGADDMSRSYSAPILQHQSRREGPFSQVRRSFCPVNRSDSVSSLEQKEGELNEEIIQAGTREEMHEFADLSMKLSATAVKLDIPLLKVFLVNHDFLEVLYNRLVNDLALWQPAAPTLRGEDSDHQINAFEDKFHSLRQEKEDEEDEIIDDGQYSSEAVCYDRSKSHVFSFCLNVNSGSLLMGTKMKQNGLLFGSGQCVLNLTDTQLYTVAGYHGDMNRIFFHFTTNKLNIGHRNNTAYEKRGQISSNVFVKEFGKFAEDESQVQTIQPFEQFSKNEESDVLGIAIEMHTRPEANIKDLLLAIAVRNTTIKFKPFRDTGHLWVTQLVELFTLRDYEIPGYELPIVTTDLQLHLDNVVVAYDHKLINPSSNTRLRFVVGQTHVTSSIITNMDISKFTCIFEESQLWISNEKKTTPSVRFDREPRAKEDSFILVTEVGLLHLDVLHCLLPEDQLKDRKTPLVEIRCRNDVIAVWICADSLVTLVNMAIEISESDAFKPVPEEPRSTSEDDEEACGGDDTRSETGASIWSKPASMVKPSRDVLPVKVEQTLQAMIGSAIREKPHKPNEAISVGIDAVEEFSIDYSKNAQEEGDSLEFESDRYRMHSLTTDEEFCMVDDGIIGTGITGADGAPTIKFIGKGQDPENVFEDSRHFRIPDEWRGDGLGALQESFPPPLLRYSIRDVSLHINIYGGSDLSRDEPKMKSYSVEEYRKGQGKGQKVLEATRGGPNRDHSVLVSVEINKISYLYQLFNKDATVMCTNLLSVYDIVVKDRLQLSNINELLYQYSNKEQPRRTCAPVLAIRIVESHQQEGRMMVSMLPIKINMDQDTMTFIQDFVEEVANAIKIPNEVVLATSTRPRIEVPAQVNNRRTSMEKPTTLNLEPLTPSPVQPPSPLGDLNYLLNKGNKSPHIDDITAAPLTASAVSIGNLFGTRTSMSNRTATPDDQSRSPDLNVTTSHLYPTEELEEEDEGLSENIFGEVEGDWRNTSEINFNDIVNQQPRTSTAVDDLLARSTMDGSFHPQYTEDALVDTSTDLSGEIDNETVCDDDDTEMAASQNQGDQPIRGNTFFKEFTFSPAASIFLDYQGKNRFSMEKGGAVLGVLCGIGQLNQAEIVLKEIHHRHGLLGIGRCLNHAANEWADDIKNNLPNVIASCGPISPIVQISKGFMDLFWMPVAEMRKEDGHVVKGLQRGVGSFGLSSAAGIVGIAQSFVGVLQSVAETVLHEVQPDSACLNRRNRRVAGRSGAPTDLRHGIQLAYGIMSDGVRQTKEDYELAAQEERASGQSGVRSILRFATPAVLRPLVMGTQMSYQLLGGLRNQLRPDMYQDERHKWRDDEVPGGSRS